MASEKSRKVLIAVDNSDIAKHAFQWYKENLRHENDSVIICHIPESPKLHSFHFKSGLQVPVHEWQESLQKVIKDTETLQNDYQIDCQQAKVHCEFAGEHCNNKGQGIINAAISHGANCIVMGTRGLDAVRRVFNTSVSDYVVHHSACPVIIVPKTAQ